MSSIASIEIMLPAVATAVSVVALAYSLFEKRSSETKTREARKLLTETKTSAGISLLGTQLKSEVTRLEPNAALTDYLLDQIKKGLLERSPDLQNLTKEELREEIDEQVNDIRSRIEKIEEKFPDVETIDKVATLNEALLAQRIEQIDKQLETIESAMLSKWDVAIIVSAVLSGVFTIVGITYGVLKVLGVVT